VLQASFHVMMILEVAAPLATIVPTSVVFQDVAPPGRLARVIVVAPVVSTQGTKLALGRLSAARLEPCVVAMPLDNRRAIILPARPPVQAHPLVLQTPIQTLPVQILAQIHQVRIMIPVVLIATETKDPLPSK